MKSDRSYAVQVAQLLRQTRLASGLSLREAAKLGGTSHATLLAYETRAKVPSAAICLRLLEAFGAEARIVAVPRVRCADSIPRGEELEAALRLAAQFPARASRHLPYPKLALAKRASHG
jgi:transcriptional regulator with XRE-family HTH domain